MKPIAKTMLLTTASAAALVVAVPTQGKACDFLHRLFCWCRRPAPVVVEPVVTPSYSYYLRDDCRTEAYYPSPDCRTEAYYPSSDCSTQIELGTQPPPAPPAEGDYLGTPPETTFEEEDQQSSQKPAEPDGAASGEASEGAQGGAPPADNDTQSSPNGGDGVDKPASGSPQSLWQPINRTAARALLSERTRSRASLRNDAISVRASHPGWVPVENVPAKRLAVK